MWSIGCIFLEICNLRAIFNATEELKMIEMIFKTLGTPNEEIWPGYSQLPYVQAVKFQEHPPVEDLREDLGIPTELLDDEGYDLLMKFLCYDPKKRILASDALEHPYLRGV